MAKKLIPGVAIRPRYRNPPKGLGRTGSIVLQPPKAPLRARTIPPKGEITSQVSSALSGAKVTQVLVFVHIAHVRVSDLTVSLIGPAGERVLFSGLGGNGKNAKATLYDDAPGANPTSSASIAVGGTFRPKEPLNSYFKGTAVAGTWKLKIVDTVHQKGGELKDWKLTLGWEIP